MSYRTAIADNAELIGRHDGRWDGIDPQAVARMQAQNRFLTGLDIARHTAATMRAELEKRGLVA